MTNPTPGQGVAELVETLRHFSDEFDDTPENTAVFKAAALLERYAAALEEIADTSDMRTCGNGFNLRAIARTALEHTENTGA